MRRENARGSSSGFPYTFAADVRGGDCRQRLPAGNWNCESTNSSKHVSSVATDDAGVVTITIQNISTDVDLKYLPGSCCG